MMVTSTEVQPNESKYDFRVRLYYLKYAGILNTTWSELAQIIQQETGINKSGNAVRKEARRLQLQGKLNLFSEETDEQLTSDKVEESTQSDEDTIRDLITEYQKERFKLQDVSTQNRYYLRRISREETLIEISKMLVKEISSKKLLPEPASISEISGCNEAIVQLSDWHYGLEVNNHWNWFNPQICRQRVSQLLTEVVDFCRQFNINLLHVVNLSDLIAGRIHTSIRLQSRVDTITQCIHVSEILAEFLSYLMSEGIQVHYYDCLDNHSRLEPIKAESLELESLARIIPWYLKERLSDYPITIHENKFADDIITFTAMNGKYNICGVHGHKDSPNKVVDNLTLMTKENYDLILTAHLHHFSCDEKNETLVISNGSLMGVDSYAKDLRLSSKPSQNIILVSEKSVADIIHRIVLN